MGLLHCCFIYGMSTSEVAWLLSSDGRRASPDIAIGAGRSSRSSRGSMPMHELRHLSSLDDVRRLWLQAYVARVDLAGFQVCQVSRSGGFQVKNLEMRLCDGSRRWSRPHDRIRALWLGSAIGPQGASAWIRSVLQALRFGLAIES